MTLTNEALQLIKEMADCTDVRDWEKLTTDTNMIGGLLSTCSDKLLVFALTRDTARSLAVELLDHRARTEIVGRSNNEAHSL